MDAAIKQILGSTASLVPFVEKNRVDRSLMASSMQKQAVPLLRPEAARVGTGIEQVVARNSSQLIVAEGAGEVVRADADAVEVKYKDGNKIYEPIHFAKSNDDRSINQKVRVSRGDKVKTGDILIEGASVADGEIALGKDLTVAFMPWGGYNMDDAIVISSKLVQDDTLTSINIKDYTVEIRETKLGDEIVTRDIPNVSEESLRHLDETGVVQIGSEVKAGDVLVGKITPKGEQELSSEERLLRAIFGEKAGHVINKSLVCPTSMEGTVVDVKVFTKKGYEKDERAVAEIASEKAELDLKHHDKLLMLDREEILKINDLLLKSSLIKDLELDEVTYKIGETIPLDILMNVNRFAMKKVVSSYPKEIEKTYNDIKEHFIKQKAHLRDEHEDKLQVLEHDDILSSGVIKQVKVYIATKRKIKVGDKMAGRHGNKGIVSNIVPKVDMPYLEDGTTVDIILNPLGVPSRMNIG